MGLKCGFCIFVSAFDCIHNYEYCRPRSRRDNVADTFPDFSNYNVTQPIPVILPKGYKKNPETLGEHIRKIRIDRGLFQREIADFIGVTEGTVFNWERGFEPELAYIPRIIEFLGYAPFESPDPDNPLEKLRYFKLINGLSFERLGALMNRDPEQLGDWFSGKHVPCKRNIQSFTAFLMLYEDHDLFIKPVLMK